MVSDERYYIERNENVYLIVDNDTNNVYIEPCDVCDLLNEKEEEIKRLTILLREKWV